MAPQVVFLPTAACRLPIFLAAQPRVALESLLRTDWRLRMRIDNLNLGRGVGSDVNQVVQANQFEVLNLAHI